MKIAMILPTRGKPHVAAAIVNAGQYLASGRHEITWILGVDDDDPTWRCLTADAELGKTAILSNAPRARALGMIYNRCAEAAPPDTDIYCQFVDDGVIASVDWDQIMIDRLALLPKSLGVISWQATDNPVNMGNPCFTREWYQLAGFYTSYFPFWWDDTWLSEKYSFVTGSFTWIVPELRIVCRKSVTRRMRDLMFWVEFFAETRKERIEEARIIRENLDMPLPGNFGWIVEQWEARDRQMRLNVPGLEATMGAHEDTEASPLYIEARDRALAHIAGTETARRYAHFAERVAA